MAVTAENLDVLLRVIGLRTFQAQMAEARASVAGVGKAAVASDEEQAAAAGASSKRAGALRTMAIGVAGALAVVAGESYKLSVNYQREVEMIHTQAGMTQHDTNMMYSQILDMSRKFPQGPEQMARGAYHLASVTHDAALSMTGLRQAAELATVGNSDLESTTSALAAVWRATRGEGLSFRQIVSLLNATVGAGNMRMQDLVQALGTGVLPVFKTGGVTLKDFGASLALLTDEGQHADNAATHLRMTLTLLAAPSKIAKKELSSIGLGTFDIANKLRSPQGMIGALELLRQKLYQKFPGRPATIDQANKIMSGMDPKAAGLDMAASQRMNVLARAFGGARSGATIMALVDQLGSLQQKEQQVQGTTKNFGDAVAKTMGLPGVRLHVAWSSLQVDMIKFGDAIKGPVTGALYILIKAVDGLIVALRWLVSTSGGHVILIFLGSLAAAWLALKVAILAARGAEIAFAAFQIIATLVTMVTEVGSLADAFALVSIAIETTPVGWILTAIAAIITAIVLIVTHWKQVKKAVSDAFNWIVKEANRLVKWVRGHWTAYLFGLLLGPFGLAAVFIIRDWTHLKRFFKTVIDFIKHHWQLLLGVLTGGIATAVIFIIKHWNTIKKPFIAVFTAVKSVVGPILSWIWGMIKNIINAVKDAVKWVGQAAKDVKKFAGSSPLRGSPLDILPNAGFALPGFASGGVMPYTGFATMNETATGETVWLPGGSTVMPSPASSLSQPRAHTPTPGPSPLNERPIVVHHETKLDGKVLYKSVTKYDADRRARS